MKTKRFIIPIILTSFSLSLISLGNAFASFFFVNNASDLDINIVNVLNTIGTGDYYVFIDNGSPIELIKDSEDEKLYSYTYNVSEDNFGKHSYKITNNQGKTLYSQTEFDIEISGDFNLSYNSDDMTSNLTFTYSLLDDGSIFGDNIYCYYTDSKTICSTTYCITGSNESLGNWSYSSSPKLISDGTTNFIKNVCLESDTSFKITNSSDWYGYSKIKNGTEYFTNDTSDNIVVSTSGSYDIVFDGNNISITQSENIDYEITSSKEENGETKYTLEIDATKYAGEDTYVYFSSNDHKKITSSQKITSILGDNRTCRINKMIYFNPGGSNLWNQANAWFLGEVTATGLETKLLQFENYDTTYYKIEVPTNYTNINFYRINPDYTYNSVIENWNTSSSTYYWNKATLLNESDTSYAAIDITNNHSFQIYDWSNNCKVDSIPSGAFDYTIVKS
jgi:hypothetical protein